MERACASSVDLHFLPEEDIPKLDMKALKYLFEYQQPEERWIPAPRRKVDLVAAVRELKARGPLSAAQIHERFGPREQSDDSEKGEEEAAAADAEASAKAEAEEGAKEAEAAAAEAKAAEAAALEAEKTAAEAEAAEVEAAEAEAAGTNAGVSGETRPKRKSAAFIAPRKKRAGKA
jgi:hypothetical protein